MAQSHTMQTEQQPQLVQQNSNAPPPITFPGQKHLFTCGMVVTLAYWSEPAPAGVATTAFKHPTDITPHCSGQPPTGKISVSIEARNMMARKRGAALAKKEAKQVANMLKTPISERRTEGQVLFAISEMIGHPKTWPAKFKDIFFLRKLNRTNRLNIITFTLGNGLPPHADMPCTNGQP